jgi:hypothetical protein
MTMDFSGLTFGKENSAYSVGRIFFHGVEALSRAELRLVYIRHAECVPPFLFTPLILINR